MTWTIEFAATAVAGSDLFPADGAEVRVSAFAVPRFFVRQELRLEDLDDEGPIFAGPDGEIVTFPMKPGQGGTIEFHHPDLTQRFSTQTQLLAADGSGTVRVSFDVARALDDAKAALNQENEQAVDSIVLFTASVSFGTLSHEFDGFLGGQWHVEVDSERTATNGRLGPLDVLLDLGHTIVGHTTDTTAMLCAVLPEPQSAGRSLEAEVVAGDGTRSTIILDLVPSETAEGLVYVNIVEGLRPSQAYNYRIDVTGTPAGTVLVGQGSFRTAPPNGVADGVELRFGFGSCNWFLGKDQTRWSALADEEDLDAVLHLGDQIYEDRMVPSPAAVTRRYRMTWGNPDTRRVLHSQSNYMIFDDHEVKDDWGTKPAETMQDHIRFGLDGYKTFQASHGPGKVRSSQKGHQFAFRKGPASFFFLDLRTQRDIPPLVITEGDPTDGHKDWNHSDSTMLGRDQLDTLKEWAREPATLDSDFIIFGSSIPPAWVNISGWLKLADAAFTAAPLLMGASRALGVLGGFFYFKDALGGGIPGGILGGAIGATPIGSILIAEAAKDSLDGALTEHDIADLWAWPPHQTDLAEFLNIAFDLANDINPDSNKPRPNPRHRAVFILSGDVHAGAIHGIRSGHEKHHAVPEILQITSSSLSRPADAGIEGIATMSPAELLHSLDVPAVSDLLGDSDDGIHQFVMDGHNQPSRFSARLIDFVPGHNYGTLELRNHGTRRYLTQVRLKPSNGPDVHRAFMYDLATSGAPRPLPMSDVDVEVAHIEIADATPNAILDLKAQVTNRTLDDLVLSVPTHSAQVIVNAARHTIAPFDSVDIPVRVEVGNVESGGGVNLATTLSLTSSAPSSPHQLRITVSIDPELAPTPRPPFDDEDPGGPGRQPH